MVLFGVVMELSGDVALLEELHHCGRALSDYSLTCFLLSLLPVCR